MEEFLRSHAGTFFLGLASAVPFFLTGMGSIGGRWRPKLIVLGELLLALLVGVAWAVGNQLARVLLGILFVNSLGMIVVGWWRQKQGMHR